MPVMCGSTTHNTATAATAASAALPPARSVSTAAKVASGCEVAAMPSLAITGERPGNWKSRDMSGWMYRARRGLGLRLRLQFDRRCRKRRFRLDHQFALRTRARSETPIPPAASTNAIVSIRKNVAVAAWLTQTNSAVIANNNSRDSA